MVTEGGGYKLSDPTPKVANGGVSKPYTAALSVLHHLPIIN